MIDPIVTALVLQAALTWAYINGNFVRGQSVAWSNTKPYLPADFAEPICEPIFEEMPATLQAA